MYRTGGIADGALRMFAGFFDGFHRGFNVTQIVQCIEYTEYINAVIRRFLHKGFHHVIGVMAITEQVLSAQ